MQPEYFYPVLGMAFALCWGVIGTFRWYLKERLKAGGGGRGAAPERLGALEARIAELEERVDFAERLLTRGNAREP